jgi:hypothetical protein
LARGGKLPVALVAVCAFLGASSCGEEGGIADGATVTSYVAASLCDTAKGELERAGGRAGDVRVRIVCLPETSSTGRLNPATIGANARRVSEDSTAIAYAEPAGVANRYGPPIIESAGIAVILTSSGELAMTRILHAIREPGDSDSPRTAVAEALGVDWSD